MRKILGLFLVLALLLSVTSLAFAETREHGTKKLSFGADYHKPWAGISLNYLKVIWDAKGISRLQYQINAWKGVVTLVDVYVVVDGKTIYKRSSERQMNYDVSYLNSAKKNATDSAFFPTPIVPGFGYQNGEIWWVVNFTNPDTNVVEKAAAVWKMKDNSIEWMFLTDKPKPKAVPAIEEPAEEPVE